MTTEKDRLEQSSDECAGCDHRLSQHYLNGCGWCLCKIAGTARSEAAMEADNPPARSPLLPLAERIALALVEDCTTLLDESDVAAVVAAVLPVAHRYGAKDEVSP